MNHGWWRRNRWGVIALLPVLAVALVLHGEDVYDDYWNGRPRAPIAPDGSGWVSYGDGRVRLAALEPASDLKKSGGDAFTPPANVAAWKATIAFEADKGAPLTSCQLFLEDASGRTYAANPNELSGARTGYASCLPDGDALPRAYQSVVYFVTPASVRPAAVRITVTSRLPRYARLTASG